MLDEHGATSAMAQPEFLTMELLFCWCWQGRVRVDSHSVAGIIWSSKPPIRWTGKHGKDMTLYGSW